LAFRRAACVPKEGEQVEDFLATALRIPRDTDYRFLGSLAAAAAQVGGCTLIEDETDPS
jgi:hypothetical protein